MRGEDGGPGPGPNIHDGSPPHARGRPIRKATTTASSRITPACAGKTNRKLATVITCRDHPRMRGEDLSAAVPSLRPIGSPPHARGRQTVPSAAWGRAGITPACAGKTRSPATHWLSWRDHPLMRGEDCYSAIPTVYIRGSPPHARGRLRLASVWEAFYGITPACAGKTHCSMKRLHRDSDHPRMRGEDARVRVAPVDVSGSPPHARGRLCGFHFDLPFCRITPACAGKTNGSGLSPLSWADHPRMRGEDTFSSDPVMCGAGSPPHARGRQRNLVSVRRQVGITPACAGKTAHGRESRACLRDHPRMRGEDS